MNYYVKPIVCDYAVVPERGNMICICNIRENAELIADILDGDSNYDCAYAYSCYPNAKYNIERKKMNE